MNGAPASLSLSRYQADFSPADMFDAGLAGYDAVFSLEPGAGDGLPQRTFARPVEVQITGSLLTYDIDDPAWAARASRSRRWRRNIPDLRRFIREGYVRYAFTRFGVPYVVSIQCLDSVPRARRLACREAYARRRALSEGAARRRRQAVAAAHGHCLRTRATGRADGRPISPIRPPGDIIADTGYRKQSGHADFTAYSQIRFPLEKAPAFVELAIVPPISEQARAPVRWTTLAETAKRRLSLAG